MTFKPPLPRIFTSKKRVILAKLAVPPSEYDDLSPKGSIDEGIRDLIDEINACEGFVTTSSCSGRISVFAEGDKSIRRSEESGGADENEELIKPAGVGGKGVGGKWLFVSHDPVNIDLDVDLASFLGMHDQVLAEHDPTIPTGCSSDRLVHFKFEPMILHVLTASLHDAQVLLSAALQAGFRESGALNITSASGETATPMVAIRSMGLALESIIGGECAPGIWRCAVPSAHLAMLLEVSNERFKDNKRRITRFKDLLAAGISAANSTVSKLKADGTEWEDAVARRERKRVEGLKRSHELKQKAENAGE